MKYDDAENYFLNFTTDLSIENGGRAIALCLEWAILRGLANEELSKYTADLRSGNVLPVALLFDACDGKLMNEDLNDEGNAFAADYYAAHYLQDFSAALGLPPDASTDVLFGTEITMQRRNAVHWRLDLRYLDWRRRRFGLSSAERMRDRFAAVIEPVAVAAGFARVDEQSQGTAQRAASFERRSGESLLRFEIIAIDSRNNFRGVRFTLLAYTQKLHVALLEERRRDLGDIVGAQVAAEIPLARLAMHWSGPTGAYGGDAGFWIFRDDDIERLAHALVAPLRDEVLPLLRSLDSEKAIADAYATVPMTSSPIYNADPYAALLAAELSHHVRLAAMLDETEQRIRRMADRSRWDDAALKLIARVRERSSRDVS